MVPIIDKRMRWALMNFPTVSKTHQKILLGYRCAAQPPILPE
jgi:hypothetical protein